MKIPFWVVTGTILFLAFPVAIFAESSSSNYILWDSAVTGGGNRSTSTNYVDYGSAGDLSSSSLSSTNYQAAVGLQAMYEDARLTMSISSTSLVFSPDTLTPAVVSTASLNVTTATNSDFGYALTATEANPFQNTVGDTIPDVADGTVSAGSNEFGIGVTGVDRAFTDDRAITPAPLVIASRDIWTTGTTTTVTVKVGVNSATTAGKYSGSITFIATGSY